MASAPDAGARARTLRVLLAEDNSVNRLLAQRQIARLGHEITIVPGGQDAVREASSGTFDVILMDRHLPDLDGLEATRRIRAAERSGRRTPIIAVTADASPEARGACLAAGMDDYLTKPLDLDQLGAALARHSARAGGNPVALDDGILVRLVQELGGDTELAEDIVDAYLDELPIRRLRIQAAARRGAAPALIAAAESLRSSSATIGAVGVAGICADVLGAAADGDMPAARGAVSSLLASCEQVQQALSAARRGAGRVLAS
jgi:CheY-like chemotaxis protein